MAPRPSLPWDPARRLGTLYTFSVTSSLRFGCSTRTARHIGRSRVLSALPQCVPPVGRVPSLACTSTLHRPLSSSPASRPAQRHSDLRPPRVRVVGAVRHASSHKRQGHTGARKRPSHARAAPDTASGASRATPRATRTRRIASSHHRWGRRCAALALLSEVPVLRRTLPFDYHHVEALRRALALRGTA